MGRCYEFGVSIREGCEHAMVVPAEGGRCECVGCGTSCPGRFKGCGRVIAQPGYIPSTAPGWSLTPPEEPAAVVAAVPTPLVPSPPSPVEDVVVGTPAQLETVIDLIEDVAKQISARDSELAALFDRFVEEFRGLRQQVLEQNQQITALGQRVVVMEERFDTIVSASLLGPIRRDD